MNFKEKGFLFLNEERMILKGLQIDYSSTKCFIKEMKKKVVAFTSSNFTKNTSSP